MPHVLVKLYSGRSDEQKARLAEAITHAVTATLHCPDDDVSVAIQDVTPDDWTESVYKPDILGNSALLFKKPGY